MISDVVIKYGNQELTEKMDLIDSPDFGLLPAVSNSTLSHILNDGEKLKRTTFGMKKISFIFLLSEDNIFDYRDSLTKMLFHKKTQKLTISLFSDRYWDAILDGDTSFVRKMDQRNETEVTLTFLVPDGIAHAVASKEYTQDSPEFDTDTFTINNEGTYRSWPILEATMPADNGVVAFINDRGKILQFGNPDEDDTRSYNVSDRVVWDKPLTAAQEASRGWKTNSYTFSGIFLNRYNLRVNGTRKFGDGYVTYDNLGTGTGMQGFSYGRKVSADSNGTVGATDFEFKAGFWFETSNYNQTGMMMAELRDASGNAICSIAFYKLSQSNNAGKIRINVQGLIYEYDFQTNDKNIHTSKGKEFSIVKSGNTITFHSGGAKNGGIIKTVRLDALKSMAMTDVVFYVGKVALTNPMARMCITHCTVRKDKVKKTDVKNLFGAEDVLTIDTASGTVALNGLETQIGAFGNDWEGFYLEPGENKIKCIYSDWAQAPTFKLYNQEAYL